MDGRLWILILIQEGYFSDNCNLTAGNRTSASQRCPSQEYNLELVYTLSVILSAVFGVIGGIIMNHFGTMVFRNQSTFLFVASCVAVAFSTTQISWILYPAVIILASSGIFLYTYFSATNRQLISQISRHYY